MVGLEFELVDLSVAITRVLRVGVNGRLSLTEMFDCLAVVIMVSVPEMSPKAVPTASSICLPE